MWNLVYLFFRKLFCRIWRFLVSFFRSWYGNIGILVLLAFLSAFVVTFYTTSEPFIRSISRKSHYITLASNMVLMLPLTLIIAVTVYRLDRSVYWTKHVVGRWLFQFSLLVVVLSVISLHVVYLLYLTLFHVDLIDMGYLERDFVLVMGCIILQQVYYKIRKVRKDRSDLHEWVGQLLRGKEGLKRQLDELKNRLEQVEDGQKSKTENCQSCKARMLFGWAILWDMTQEIDVSFDSTAFERINVRFISRVYFEKTGSSKLFYATLMDGRQALLKINALSALENVYAAILLKNTRYELVNILAIRKVFLKDEKWYLDMFGGGIREISREQRGKLLDHYKIFTQGLQEAKELLNEKSQNKKDMR